ncbi:MAG TPA: glycosyl hydrolase family 18 protein [Acidimicrobiales bacterium]|nr:glycosyl hydrolase family 18 protein [Acidimicrobiales bacterium]
MPLRPPLLTRARPPRPVPAADLSAWQLLTRRAYGQVLVPGIGLRATSRGLGVMGQDGRTVRSWSWDHVLEIGAGTSMPGLGEETLRLVEVKVDDGRHLFVCPDRELVALRSALERHAPSACERLRDLDHVPPQTRIASPRRAAPRPRAMPGTLPAWAVLGTAALPTGVVPRLRARLLRPFVTVRNWRYVSLRERLEPIGAGLGALALIGGGVLAGTGAIGGTANAAGPSSGGSIMSRMAHEYGSKIDLPAATSVPAPAPPSLAGAPALQSHEIFGFAPYWTLPDSSGFDLRDLTTLAYFSVDVNADGSISRSGAGWDGYESQDLADLITRAHEAGDRVVLTASCFDQPTLDALTSNPDAPATLGSSLVSLLGAKNMDGVNFDFEGQGSQDQAGLDRLISEVSTTLRKADPHWQVTMDTYGSSAGDPEGFYDVGGLAPSVDAFFVMGYDMGAPATPSPTAALTGPGFNDLDALEQYTSVVPASKVILGVPYYGYDWPTAGPAQGDAATGPATPVSYSQIGAAGHPVYWDPATQTPWTSYQVGTQWYQTWFDDATSLALKAQLANSYHIAGLGVWALGMDGNNHSMMAALLGDSPVVKNFSPSPPPDGQTQAPASPGQPGAPAAPTSTTSPSSQPAGQNGQSPGSTTTTTTTTTVTPSAYKYTGTWDQQTVTLNLVASAMAPVVNSSSVGLLTNFQTNDPAFTCLESGPPLPVYSSSGASGVYVVEARTPADCAQGTWEFVAQPQSSSSSAGEGAADTSSVTPQS